MPVKITWISNEDDAIHVGDGADIPALLEHARTGGRLRDLPYAKLCGHDEVIGAPVTALIAASGEGTPRRTHRTTGQRAGSDPHGRRTLTLEGQQTVVENAINFHSEAHANFGGSLGSCQEVERAGLSLPDEAETYIEQLAPPACEHV